MIFLKFKEDIQKKIQFQIKYKNESLLMKLIGKLLFFNNGFMTDYVTTIGNNIYFPSEKSIKEDEQKAIAVLSHELVHIKQSKKYRNIIFNIMYLFPQCLALLILLTPISYWFLLSIIFLLPLPAPFRMMFEAEAYIMNLFMFNERCKFLKITKEDTHLSLNKYATLIDKNYFKGSAYWFMWPFGTNLINKIPDIENDVISNTDEIYDCVRRSYWNAVS